MPALRHEYVHYLLRQSARPLPLWLEEGLAEHFSGVSPEAARSRARLLQRGGWIPLTSLIQAGRESQWYRQSEFAERFYAQSWALVDLLVKRAGGACGRQQMESWAAGDFGAPGELENELQRHVGSLRGRTPPAAAAAKVELAPAGDGEVALALACLKMQIGDLDGAGARLAAGPESPAEAWALQGEIELRRGRKPDALQAFRRALRLGSGDRRALWNLVVLEQAESNGSAVPALERLLAVDPGFDEARLVLSSHYLQQRRYGDALAQLRSIRMAPPGRSGYMQQAMALAESQSRAGGRGDR